MGSAARAAPRTARPQRSVASRRRGLIYKKKRHTTPIRLVLAADPAPGTVQQRQETGTQASTLASMLLASVSPHSASVAVSSTPLYTKRSTALAPAACSLVFRSAAVSDGEIWIDTFDSVIFKLCVGVIHGVSGIGGYEGGVRLMSDRRDFLGRVCSWCFVAFFCTW
jgi:hypothetical protein